MDTVYENESREAMIQPQHMATVAPNAPPMPDSDRHINTISQQYGDIPFDLQ